jgi:hypothetical protein
MNRTTDEGRVLPRYEACVPAPDQLQLPQAGAGGVQTEANSPPLVADREARRGGDGVQSSLRRWLDSCTLSSQQAAQNHQDALTNESGHNVP